MAREGEPGSKFIRQPNGSSGETAADRSDPFRAHSYSTNPRVCLAKHPTKNSPHHPEFGKSKYPPINYSVLPYLLDNSSKI